MDALQVRRMHARYRLPTSLLHERVRLDRIFEEVVDRGLADATAVASLPADAEVCIRSLDVTVRLRIGATDRVAAEAWSAGLLAAVDAAVAGGREDVARYPSRAHAVVEMATGAVRGDLDRWWAWTQLGLWTVGGQASSRAAMREAVRAMSGEPETIVPTIDALARIALGARFLADAGDGVRTLARAALRVADADPGLLTDPVGDGGGGDRRPSAARTPEWVGASGGAGEALERPLGLAAMQAARSVADPNLRRALAALVALAVDPAGVRAPVRGRALVSALASALAQASESRGAQDRGDAVEDPEKVTTSGEAPVPAELRAVAVVQRDDAQPVGTVEGTRPINPTEPAPPSVRQTGRTNAGGLLFLLRILDRLDVPGELARGEAFAARSVRSWLHRLAMALAELEPADPGALAFAGLPPDAPAPSSGEPPLSPPERSALAEIARRIVADLESGVEPTADGPEDLLTWVCRRPAEIVADPGWIEARFELTSVDLDLRRAGLDLDPGYLPWLGSVVRFRYG